MTPISNPAAMPAHRVAQPVQPSRPTSTGILARRPVIGLVLLIIGAAVFSILAVNVRTNGPLLAWDMPIDQALHTYAEHDWRADFYAMRFAGTLGRETALGITILLSLYWLWKRYWREASMLIIGAFGGNLWFELLSHLFNRHRPVWPDPLDPLPGPGFPSGHTMSAVLLYGLLLYLLWPHLKSWAWRSLAIIDTLAIILLVGYSRLYMGAHFPTDVLAGYSFGLVWGSVVYTSLELFFRHRAAKARAAT